MTLKFEWKSFSYFAILFCMTLLTNDVPNSSDGNEQVGQGARRKVREMSSSITDPSVIATEAGHANGSLKSLWVIAKTTMVLNSVQYW